MGFFFQEKGHLLSLFLFHFFPTSIFPNAPKIWTLVHQKLACVRSSCIRLLQGEHWAVRPELTLTFTIYLQKR
jgi:hypothetical protein